MATKTTVSILDNVFHAEINVNKTAKHMQYLATMCISYGTGENVTSSVKNAAAMTGKSL